MPQEDLRRMERRRPIISPLSTISSTGKPSNTCRTRRGRRKAASGAPAVMTMRCSSMGVSTSRSSHRSIRRRLTPAWRAPVAMPSSAWTAPWAITDSPSSTPPLHQLMTSKNKAIRSLVDFMTYLNPEPHRETFMKPFMTTAIVRVLLDVPQSSPRYSGQQLSLVPRL